MLRAVPSWSLLPAALGAGCSPGPPAKATLGRAEGLPSLRQGQRTAWNAPPVLVLKERNYWKEV